MVSKDQLLQALKNAKYQGATKDIDSKIDKFTQLIDELIKISDKRDSDTVLRQLLEKDGLEDNEISEILTVW